MNNCPASKLLFFSFLEALCGHVDVFGPAFFLSFAFLPRLQFVIAQPNVSHNATQFSKRAYNRRKNN